jgi:hypothetical protein
MCKVCDVQCISHYFCFCIINMLSRVIKNTLLVLLIIIIIHFIIKNRVLETVALTKKKAELNQQHIDTSHGKKLTTAVEEAKLERLVKHDEAALKSRLSQDQDIKDLYNFVFDQTSKQELSSYFPEPPKCTEVNEAGQGHKAVISHHESLKKNPALPTSHNYFKNAVSLQEYQDENVMNGGKMDQCLLGYDPLADNGFMELEKN